MYTRIRTASLQPFLKLNFSYRQIINSVQLIPTHPQFKMETFFKKKKKKKDKSVSSTLRITRVANVPIF